MGIVCTVGGVDYSSDHVVPGSIRIKRTVKGRASASVTLLDLSGSLYLNDDSIGLPITIGIDSDTITGTIDEFDTTLDFDHPVSPIRYNVQIQDVNPFDRRIVSRRYPPLSIWKNIVQDIVENFLDGEGIDTTNVDGFGMIDDALEFDYRTVREAFNTLTDLSGEDWWCIGTSLYFKATGAARPPAPFSLTDATRNWAEMKISRKRSTSYRNRQFLRTKVQLASGTMTDTHTGDGSTWLYYTAFPLSEAPVVTINGSPATVYERGVDPPGQSGWYWFRGGTGIAEGTETAPALGATIVFEYNGYASNVVMVEDTAAQAARAAVEGGSGIWEYLDEANDVDTLDVASQLAQGLLNKGGELPMTITYRTDHTGLQCGMAQTVNVAKLGINATYYITDIDSADMPAKTPFFRHSVTLSKSMDQSRWSKFWHEWWSRTKTGRIGSGFGGVATGGTEANCCARFDLGAGGNLEVGKETPYAISEIDGPLLRWDAVAKSAPSGSDATIEFRSAAGVVLATITIPAGSTALQNGAISGTLSVAKHSVVGYCRVTGIGSSVAGGDVTVKIYTAA